jgi:trimeric autotransporter adhesin
MKTARTFRSICATVIALTLGVGVAACGSSPTAPATVQSVTVSGGTPVVGSSSQFTALANMSNGTSQDVTSLATWTTSDNTVATVSSTGVVTAVADGSASVQATYQTVTGTEVISITQ